MAKKPTTLSDRYVCYILDDARECLKRWEELSKIYITPGNDYSYLKSRIEMEAVIMASLLEELQVRGNRMEDGLDSSRKTGRKIHNELKKDNPDLDRIQDAINRRWNFE